MFRDGGRATVQARGVHNLPYPDKLRIPSNDGLGVRLRGISFAVERETAQIGS